MAHSNRERGRKTEQKLFELLTNNGYSVIRTHKASESGAPLIHRGDNSIRSFDLFVLNPPFTPREVPLGVECKLKGSPCKYDGELRHGIPSAQLEDYRKAAEDCPVVIVIYEENNGTWLAQRLTNLTVADTGPPLDDETTDTKWFNRDDFVEVPNILSAAFS